MRRRVAWKAGVPTAPGGTARQSTGSTPSWIAWSCWRVRIAWRRLRSVLEKADLFHRRYSRIGVTVQIGTLIRLFSIVEKSKKLKVRFPSRFLYV